MTSITNAPLSPVHENNKDYYNNEYICIHTRGEEQHTRGDIEREYTSLSYKQNQTTVRIHWNTLVRAAHIFGEGFVLPRFPRNARGQRTTRTTTTGTNTRRKRTNSMCKQECKFMLVFLARATNDDSDDTGAQKPKTFFSLAHGPTKTKDTHPKGMFLATI